MGALVDIERLGPLTSDCVQSILLLTTWIHRCSERILLARKPALSGVIDLASVSRGRSYVGLVIELDERRTEDEAFYMQIWQSDDVCFTERWNRVDRMADLLDIDRALERSLLCVIAFESDAVLSI